MSYLARLWEHVRARAAAAPAGSVVHEDLPLSLRVLRDELARGVSRVLVDSAREHARMLEFAAAFMPGRGAGASSCTAARGRSSTCTASRRRSPRRSIARCRSSPAATW